MEALTEPTLNAATILSTSTLPLVKRKDSSDYWLGDAGVVISSGVGRQEGRFSHWLVDRA